MLTQEQVSVNLFEKVGTQNVLPNQPILSSRGLGWSGLQLEYHHQPPYETPEFWADQSIISIIRTEYSYLNERKEGGKFQARYDNLGDIYIYPAQQLIHHRWHSEAKSIHLYIDQQFFNLSAENPAELLPQVGIRDSLIQEIGLSLKSELEQENYSRLYAESVANFLAAHLVHRYSHRKMNSPNHTGGLPKYKLQRVIDYIQAHLAENISLEAIATELNMSSYYFCRLFKQSMGVSPYQYVLRCRIDRGRELLSAGNRNVADVAAEVGFSSQSQFTRHFKRIFGISPTQARR